MDSTTIFAQLRDALAGIYPREEDARLVAHDAGLDEGRIAFSARAQTNWQNILTEADRTGRVDALLNAIPADYANQPQLKRAISDYRRFAKRGGRLSVSSSASSGHNAPFQVEQAKDFFAGQWVIALLGGTVSSAVGGVLTNLIWQWLESSSAAPVPSKPLPFVTFLQSNVWFVGIILALFVSGSIFAVWLNSAAPWYRKKYLQHLIYEHRDFDIKGLSTQSEYTLGLRDVFVELTIKPQPIHRASTDIVRPLPEDLKGQQSIWTFLRHKELQNLVIIGPPGSGKTTLIKHVALVLAFGRKARRQAKARRRLPIFLFLRQHADAISDDQNLSLSSILDNELGLVDLSPPSGWFARHLAAGKCLVLLDGLDEVADAEKRQSVSRWVERQMATYQQCLFVITSRPHGYRDNPLKGVAMLEVQPFSQQQVEQFVHNWYLANEIKSSQLNDEGVRRKAKNGGDDLLRRLRNTPTLSMLAVNPLLLTMIATVHRYRSSLPGRRVELYAEVCEVFLGKRQRAKGLEDNLTPPQKQRVLQLLAFHMMRNEQRDISLPEAKRVLATRIAGVVGERGKVEEFLTLIETGSGLLLQRKEREYSFAHLAFQEYLAAVHALQEREESILLEQISHPWWHEVVRLYAAQTDASNIIAKCLEQNALPIQSLVLAFECLDEAQEVKPDLRVQLEALLNEGAGSSDPERRRLAAEVLLALRQRHMVRINETIYVDPAYVTHAEYQLFLDEKRQEGQYLQPDHWQQYTFPEGQALHAVVGVRAEDAQAFCKWLSQRTSRGGRFRLPIAKELDRYGLTMVEKSTQACGYWVRHVAYENFMNFETSTLVYNLDLDRTLNLEWGRGRALDRARAIESSTNLDRARARARSGARTISLEDDQFRDLDIAIDRDRKHSFNLDRIVTHAFDRNLGRDPSFDLGNDQDLAILNYSDSDCNLAFDYARNRIRERNLDLDLNLDGDSKLVRNPAIDPDHRRKRNRALARVIVFGLVAYYARLLENIPSRGRFYQSQKDTAYKQLLINYLDIYIDLVVLEERIQGNLPAVESVRLVHEW